VYRRRTRADVQRLGQVLAGLEFPAAKWQLIMHAEDYGADAETRAELWALPSGTYADLRTVLVALDAAAAPPARRNGYRAQPTVQAAGRSVPVR
jgi:Protein of unknown function (DUF2795)